MFYRSSRSYRGRRGLGGGAGPGRWTIDHGFDRLHSSSTNRYDSSGAHSLPLERPGSSRCARAYCSSTNRVEGMKRHNQYQMDSFVFERGTQSSPRAHRLGLTGLACARLGRHGDLRASRRGHVAPHGAVTSRLTARSRRASRRGHGAGDPTRSQPRAPLARPGLRPCVLLKCNMQPTCARRSATASTRLQPRATRLAGWGR
jgi:hypothetical protein